MSKRKLSDQQARRIQLIQAERRRRAEKIESKIDELVKEGQLGPPESGLLITQFGTEADVEGPDGKLYRCKQRQHLGTLVAGDRVIWRPAPSQSGVIVAVEERKTVLGRMDRHHRMKPVAANLDQLIIVAAKEPAFQTYLIDSYLVAATVLHLEAVLCLNKADLLKNNDPVLAAAHWYESIGVRVMTASAQSQEGLQDLSQALNNKTSVFVGQSGVGKSSLISAFIPEAAIKVAAISEQTLHGRHTTSNSRLYHLSSGGDLIDSPGIREFGLWHMNPREIAAGFIEFQPYYDHCKFRDCSHEHEPHCALRLAVEEGKISKDRFQNFKRLCRELD